ncbi:MAG: PKD domain-containing protein, partial [Chitinophagales bacterium]|nr:PKD domain-containing protein [Chitinophagales bacterium]
GSVGSTRTNPFLVCRYAVVQLNGSVNSNNYNWGALSGSNNNSINVFIDNTFGTPFNTIDSFNVSYNCGQGNGTEIVTIYFKVYDVKINASSSLVCLPGGFSTLNANTSSGFTTNSFAWTPSATLSANNTAIVTATPSSNTTYQVIAQSTNGCADTATVSINASTKPTANFTFSPASPICSGTNVTFANTSTGSGPLTYSWNFGDGTPPKSTTNPSHVFNAPAGSGNQTYSIILTVSNASGCSSKDTLPITVWEAPSAVLMPLPDNCLQAGSSANYQLDIYNLTPPAGVTNFAINWGDGGSNVVNPVPQYGDIISHNYSSMGNFIVTLTTTNAAGCTTIVKDTFFNGSNPSVGIANPGNTSGCYPNSSYFTFPLSGLGTNPPGTVYDFYVNDGSSNIAGGIPTISWAPPAAPPSGANFSFTQTTVNGVVQTFFNYHFLKSSCGTTSDLFANAFKITLIARNPCGISQSSVTPIYINEAPQAAFNASDTLICVGSSITFTSTTIAGQIITPAATGFGSTCTSTFNSFWNVSPNLGVSLLSGVYGFYPSITGSTAITCQFNQPGTYTVRLITRNACFQNDTALRVICVVPQPVPAFVPSIKKGCAPLAINVQNNSGPASGCQPIQYKWRVQYLSNPPCAVGSNFSFTNSTDSTSLSPSLNFINPGRYVLLLLATNKCGTFVKRDTITVKDKPQVSMPSNPNVCSASQFITPTATVMNCGENAISYSWTFVSGIPGTSNLANPGPIQFVGSTTHTIGLTVVNECGSANANTAFVMYPPVQVNAGRDTAICQNQPLNLNAQIITGTSPFAVSWTPTAGVTSPNALTTPVSTTVGNTYTVSVIDAHACQGNDQVVVSIKPLPIINCAPATICKGSNATLVASGADSYSWSPNTALSASTGASVIASPTTTTTYTVTGTSNITGCSNSIQVVVTVVNIPLVSVSPSIKSICAGSSTLLTASGASSYSWSPGINISSTTGATVSVTPTVTTTYVVTGTNGATSCSDTGIAIITVLPLPTVTVNSGTICAGANMNLIAQGALNYTWSPIGAGLSSNAGPVVVANPSTTTTYVVSGSDANACVDTAHAVVVVNPLPTLFSGNANFCYGGSVTLNASGANVYSWSPSTGLNTSTG